ncbi:polyhydroxyalkanoate synthesis repressor PhaR [Parvularcula sp. IMCC14364]|uniref:polyhydroxyalkanoate synthesis repressor PhaR n=1 Tax=Parvularcula sp. IMCC14364 TaxID=3067902 RepID=UPI002741E3FF|nr:polyhydroxyalkanoate synthesis repressor PhaR [Parvularcula sp. IMCC14364]
MASHENQQNATAGDKADIITIKKYANRRLYNTATSSYVTLEYLSQMVRNNEEFVVRDAKTGDDITRSVLTQIIFEEENKGQNLLPVNFLRRLIRYYGDSLQSFVPSYLEMSMESFQKNQETIRQSMSGAFSEAPGFKIFEDVTRQNMAMFEQGMKMFGVNGGNTAFNNPAFNNPWASMMSNTDAPESRDAEIQSLKDEIESLKSQLAEKK